MTQEKTKDKSKYAIMKQIEALSLEDKRELSSWLSDKVSNEMEKDFNESLSQLGK